MSFVADLLYPVAPLAPRKRTKSMRVLGLGLSRSGTASLCAALQELGYDHVYHGFDVGLNGNASIRKAWSDMGDQKWVHGNAPTREDFDALIGHCEAVTDMPCACFAIELIEAYPEAKVILNYRDPDAWYRSMHATFLVLIQSRVFKYLSYFDTTLYWLRRVFLMYDRYFFEGSLQQNGVRILRVHHARIRGSVSPDRLLEWRVEEGWGPLCRFLEKDVPAGEFPKGNTPEDLQKRGAANRQSAQQRAYRNVALATSLLVIIIALAVYK